MNIDVENKNELLAIHKLICAVKRSDDPDLPEALFSPFIASFADKVISAIIQTEINEGNLELAEQWKNSINVDNESILTEKFKKVIKDSTWWESLSEDEKRTFIWIFFSPCKPTKETFGALIEM